MNTNLYKVLMFAHTGLWIEKHLSQTEISDLAKMVLQQAHFQFTEPPLRDEPPLNLGCDLPAENQ